MWIIYRYVHERDVFLKKSQGTDTWCDKSFIGACIVIVLVQITVCAEQIVRELEPPEKTKSLATVQQTRRQKMQQQR